MNNSMNHCEQLKVLLVEKDQAAIAENIELAAHVEACSECQKLLQAWDEIPGLLDQLPEYEPTEVVVKAINEKVTAPGETARDKNRRRLLAPSLASAAVLLAAVGLSRELLMHEAPKAPVSVEKPRAAGQTVAGPDTGAGFERFNDDVQSIEKQKAAGKHRSIEPGRLEEDIVAESEDQPDVRFQARVQAELQDGRIAADHLSNVEEQIPVSEPAPAAPAEQPVPLGKSGRDSEAGSREDRRFRDATDYKKTDSPTQGKELYTEPTKDRAGSKVSSEVNADKNNKMYSNDSDGNVNQVRDEEISGLLLNDGQAKNEGSSRQSEIAQKRARVHHAGETATNTPIIESLSGGYAISTSDHKNRNDFDFLAYYQQTQNLNFQPSTGYWENTYVPGDPEIRLLSARLAQWDRSWLQGNKHLEQDVRPVQQPFDAPADNALALSLMSDASAVFASQGSSSAASERPTRMRLQVGIRGIEHRRGQRPAMNVALVVDLPADTTDEVRIATRSLLDAMLQSKLSGDHFSLVLTGTENRPQGLVVPDSDFRFGSLQLAKQIILGETIESVDHTVMNTAPTDPVTSNINLNQLDLYQAIEYAGTQLHTNDDPSRPLGSSSIVVIAAKQFDGIDRLRTLAHKGAVDGTTLSVFPLGDQVQVEEIDALVLAGLGNRRFLEAPSQARQLIEEELHASSRAVARAARVSIRLAPGVQLIEVLGSERLDDNRAERVREIEHSMDQRLSTNLGIQADRGDDEEGLQILIPSIFSGDSVTILLDVLTNRPGAIADVSLRYKDLVFLRNGSLQGHLELAADHSSATTPERGPAELVVLKNLLSYHFVTAVEQAAAAMGRHQADEAAEILRAMHTTIEQARQSLPVWSNDPDLIRDQQVLERYIAALVSPQADSHQSFLTDSLQYAAWAKTHRPLPEQPGL